MSDVYQEDLDLANRCNDFLKTIIIPSNQGSIEKLKKLADEIDQTFPTSNLSETPLLELRIDVFHAMRILQREASINRDRRQIKELQGNAMAKATAWCMKLRAG